MRKRFVTTFLLMFLVTLVGNVILVSFGYAQETPAAPGPAWKQLLNMFVLSVLPALWAAVGPMATAGVTKVVNKVGVYVPRPVQVILSGLIAAIGAGLTGDPSVGNAALAAASGQVMAATDPATLRTTAPEQ